eukprot:g11043.t1
MQAPTLGASQPGPLEIRSLRDRIQKDVSFFDAFLNSPKAKTQRPATIQQMQALLVQNRRLVADLGGLHIIALTGQTLSTTQLGRYQQIRQFVRKNMSKAEREREDRVERERQRQQGMNAPVAAPQPEPSAVAPTPSGGEGGVSSVAPPAPTKVSPVSAVEPVTKTEAEPQSARPSPIDTGSSPEVERERESSGQCMSECPTSEHLDLALSPAPLSVCPVTEPAQVMSVLNDTFPSPAGDRERERQREREVEAEMQREREKVEEERRIQEEREREAERVQEAEREKQLEMERERQREEEREREREAHRQRQAERAAERERVRERSMERSSSLTSLIQDREKERERQREEEEVPVPRQPVSPAAPIAVGSPTPSNHVESQRSPYKMNRSLSLSRSLTRRDVEVTPLTSHGQGSEAGRAGDVEGERQLGSWEEREAERERRSLRIPLPSRLNKEELVPSWASDK